VKSVGLSFGIMRLFVIPKVGCVCRKEFGVFK